MTNSVDRSIFHIASALEVPVLIAALLTLLVVIVELGAFAVEVRTRRSRRFTAVEDSAQRARTALDQGDRSGVHAAVAGIGWSAAMATSLRAIADKAGLPGDEPRLAKELADFDFGCQSRLARTRILVRFGPALGLMGTLIPLSPALEGLAKGNVTQLTQNLRVAFSVTVLGLLVGAVAFAISLYRDRYYGQDLSDLEYVCAVLTDEDPR